MRALNEAQNINPSDADFVNGSTRNDVTGGAEGTIFSEELMGDLVQTIQKLISLNGLTPNSLKDNETNKHQLLAALFQEGLPEWRSTTSNVLFDTIKFVRYGDAIYFHKTTTNTTTPPDTDTTNWIKVLEYDNTNDVFILNQYKQSELNFVSVNANTTLDVDYVSQSGNVITGRGRIIINNTLASGAVELFRLPTSIAPPNNRYWLNFITGDQFGTTIVDSRECVIFETGSADPRSILAANGGGMLIGRQYLFNFTYTV